MNRVCVCFLLAFSLLVAPVAHAAGFDCQDTGCTFTNQPSNDKQQDDGKLAGAGHHCCCNHVVARATLKTADAPMEISSAFILTEQINLASITVGPLLEPPSRA